MGFGKALSLAVSASVCVLTALRGGCWGRLPARLWLSWLRGASQRPLQRDLESHPGHAVP